MYSPTSPPTSRKRFRICVVSKALCPPSIGSGVVSPKYYESVPERLLHAVLMSYIFFKLSIFERHHAQKKVYSLPIQPPADTGPPPPPREPTLVQLRPREKIPA
jgi:hypothetical protein